MAGSTVEIEVIVQSTLQAQEPQGRFKITINSAATVEALLHRLCKEANAPMLAHYALRDAKNQILTPAETLENCDVLSGSILHWTDEGTRTKGMNCMCNTWWFLCILALLIGSGGMIGIAVIKSKDNKPVYDYGIVFDAGSSHTSMYVYRWDGAKVNQTALAAQYGDPVTPHDPGISSFEDDPQKAKGVITFCLDHAKNRIPSKRYKKTPVFLGATAGMRLLKDVNRTKSDAIIKVIQDTIVGYPFKFKQADARIITGEEEGTFSWITTNYILGDFNVQAPEVGINEGSTKKTTGALDMGGASTQITFIPQNTTDIPDGYSNEVQLYYKNYTLYTHSFLCYGVVEARRRLRAALVKSQNFSETITDPCAPLGWQANISNSDIFQAPCVSGSHALETFGSQITPLKIIDLNATFMFTGESNPQKCQKFVEENLFNLTASCNYTSCSFNGQFQPPVTGNFYAFSSYYYVTSFLNLTKGGKKFTLEQFTDAFTDLCNKTWDEVKTIPAVQKSSLPDYCFQANFINTILTKGYKFNSSSWNLLNFVGKIADTKIGWSLGFMINESNEIPQDIPQKLLTLVAFILLIILFTIFLFISLAFACHARRYGRLKKRQQYKKLAEYGSV